MMIPERVTDLPYFIEHDHATILSGNEEVTK